MPLGTCANCWESRAVVTTAGAAVLRRAGTRTTGNWPRRSRRCSRPNAAGTAVHGSPRNCAEILQPLFDFRSLSLQGAKALLECFLPDRQEPENKLRFCAGGERRRREPVLDGPGSMKHLGNKMILLTIQNLVIDRGFEDSFPVPSPKVACIVSNPMPKIPHGRKVKQRWNWIRK